MKLIQDRVEHGTVVDATVITSNGLKTSLIHACSFFHCNTTKIYTVKFANGTTKNLYLIAGGTYQYPILWAYDATDGTGIGTTGDIIMMWA